MSLTVVIVTVSGGSERWYLCGCDCRIRADVSARHGGLAAQPGASSFTQGPLPDFSKVKNSIAVAGLPGEVAKGHFPCSHLPRWFPVLPPPPLSVQGLWVRPAPSWVHWVCDSRGDGTAPGKGWSVRLPGWRRGEVRQEAWPAHTWLWVRQGSLGDAALSPVKGDEEGTPHRLPCGSVGGQGDRPVAEVWGRQLLDDPVLTSRTGLGKRTVNCRFPQSADRPLRTLTCALWK